MSLQTITSRLTQMVGSFGLISKQVFQVRYSTFHCPSPLMMYSSLFAVVDWSVSEVQYHSHLKANRKLFNHSSWVASADLKLVKFIGLDTTRLLAARGLKTLRLKFVVERRSKLKNPRPDKGRLMKVGRLIDRDPETRDPAGLLAKLR